MLWLAKRVIFGKVINSKIVNLKDLNFTEIFILTLLVMTVIVFGFYPSPIFETMSSSVDNLIDNYQLSLNEKVVENN